MVGFLKPHERQFRFSSVSTTRAFREGPQQGQIFWVRDEIVRLPPDDQRSIHDSRTVLVLSSNQWNSQPDCPSVLVYPVSSGAQATSFDVRLGAGLGGLMKRSWARTALVQTLDIRWLSDNPLATSGIPSDKFQDVLVQHMSMLGISL